MAIAKLSGVLDRDQTTSVDSSGGRGHPRLLFLTSFAQGASEVSPSVSSHWLQPYYDLPC